MSERDAPSDPAGPDGAVAPGESPRADGEHPGAVPHDAPPPPSTPADRAADWRSRRREAADAHEAALRARRQAESARARELIARFVADARDRGVAPEPLHAQGYGGRGRYRTPLQGWYLRRDRTVAVGTDGGFYVLTVPPSLAARLRGVRPEPQDPPLVIGAGGKDGESLDLPVALARALGDDPT